MQVTVPHSRHTQSDSESRGLDGTKAPPHFGFWHRRLLKCEPRSVGSVQRRHIQSKNHFCLKNGRRINVGLSAFIYWLVISCPASILYWAITWMVWSALMTVLVLHLKLEDLQNISMLLILTYKNDSSWRMSGRQLFLYHTRRTVVLWRLHLFGEVQQLFLLFLQKNAGQGLTED